MREPQVRRDELSYYFVSSAVTQPSPGALAIDRIREIQVRSRGGRGGLLIGGGIGFAFGLIAGVPNMGDDLFEIGPGEVMLLSLMTAGTGALIGGLIDLATPGWKTVYER